MSQVIETQISRIGAAAAAAESAQSSQAYEALDREARRMQELAREVLQASVKEQVALLVEKLENREKLDEEEQELIGLLIVGDARKILETEHRLAHWRAEAAETLRLMQNCAAQAAAGDPESLLALDAYCHMLRTILPELTFYMREKERLAQFESNNLALLDSQAASMLAEVLKSMISSARL
jgi:hypothetical protein